MTEQELYYAAQARARAPLESCCFPCLPARDAGRHERRERAVSRLPGCLRDRCALSVCRNILQEEGVGSEGEGDDDGDKESKAVQNKKLRKASASRFPADASCVTTAPFSHFLPSPSPSPPRRTATGK